MPTRQENLQTIRAAAIKVNPSIIDQKIVPGTRLKHNEGWECIAVGYPDKHDGVAIDNGYCPVKCFEILGRPIRLLDCLAAIQQKVGIKEVILIDHHGQFYRAPFLPEIKNLGIYWNLLNDNLEDQSDTTLEFIAQLVK